MEKKVVIIHGLSNGVIFMKPIGTVLKKAGFKPFYFSYSAREGDGLYFHTKKFNEFVSDFKGEEVFVVAHSYGALIFKNFLSSFYKPGSMELKRIVFISPVINGSILAERFYKLLDSLKLNFLYRLYLGSPWKDILPENARKIKFLPPDSAEVGIIRGRFFHPFLKGIKNDGTATVFDNEPLEKETVKEIVELPFEHTTILLMPETARLVTNFLKNGSFKD